MTTQNPNNAAPVASFTPPLSNSDSTDGTRNVLASGKDSIGGVKRGRVIATSFELRCDREIARIRLLVPAKRGESACVICGSTKGVSNHHETYFAPRDVIPLCAHHHRRRHVRLSKQGRDPGALYIAGRAAGRPSPIDAPMTKSQAVQTRWRRVRAMETAQPGVE